MVAMNRLRVEWSGTVVVGGGLSTFYWDPATGAGAAGHIKTFFNSIKTAFPTGITWTINDTGDQIDPVNGNLVGTWSAAGTGGTVTSSGGPNFAVGVGTRVKWNTGGIYRGRRVRGSTFLVPLLANAYTSTGVLDPAYVSTIQTAAAALVAANPGLLVYSREADADAHHPHTDGQSNFIVSAQTPNKVSWLISRRT